MQRESYISFKIDKFNVVEATGSKYVVNRKHDPL